MSYPNVIIRETQKVEKKSFFIEQPSKSNLIKDVYQIAYDCVFDKFVFHNKEQTVKELNCRIKEELRQFMSISRNHEYILDNYKHFIRVDNGQTYSITIQIAFKDNIDDVTEIVIR